MYVCIYACTYIYIYICTRGNVVLGRLDIYWFHFAVDRHRQGELAHLHLRCPRVGAQRHLVDMKMCVCVRVCVCLCVRMCVCVCVYENTHLCM